MRNDVSLFGIHDFFTGHIRSGPYDFSKISLLNSSQAHEIQSFNPIIDGDPIMRARDLIEVDIIIIINPLEFNPVNTSLCRGYFQQLNRINVKFFLIGIIQNIIVISQ